MKKWVIASILLALYAGMNAQTTAQEGPRINDLLLIPYHQPPAPEGIQIENSVGVDLKIEQPELVSLAVVVLKNRITGAEVKTVNISFIQEDGYVYYVYNERKRAINRNYASIVVSVGEAQFESLSAEAYLVDRTGNQSEKAFF